MKRIAALLIIIISLTAMWSIYGRYESKSRLATVKSGEYTEIISADALIIRNEKTVDVSGSGYFQNSLPSGSKVHTGENLGMFYSGTPDEDLVKRLNAVNEKLREVSSAGSSEKLFVNDISSINEKINEYTKQISALASKNDQKAINEIKADIENLLERKANIEAGTGGGKADILSSLNAEKASLTEKLGSNTEDIFAPSAGIFIGTADGLENRILPADIGKYSVSEIEGYIKGNEKKEKIYPQPICKVVDNSSWIAAFICKAETADKLQKSGRVEVKLNGGQSSNAECRVLAVSEEQKGKKAVFVSGTGEIYQLLVNRTAHIEIFADKYEGLKIPANALIYSGGKSFAEVSKGRKTVKKPVEVLYKDKNIAIIKEDNTKKDNLLLYEEVVVHDDK